MATGVSVSELDRNLILAPLPQAERARIAERAESYESDHQILVQPGGTIEYAYFPSLGLISVVAALRNGRRAEIATVGWEGMAGLPLLLGSPSSLHEITSQVSGHGLRMTAATFTEESARNPEFRARLLKYAELRMAMLGQTAACNAAHHIGARLARWLLLSHDSVDGDEFVLTHEFVAQMLGAERPSVTLAAGPLQKRGLITYRRGKVQIRDRAGLERAACECYAVVRHERERLMESRPGEQTGQSALRQVPNRRQDGPEAV